MAYEGFILSLIDRAVVVGVDDRLSLLTIGLVVRVEVEPHTGITSGKVPPVIFLRTLKFLGTSRTDLKVCQVGCVYPSVYYDLSPAVDMAMDF